MCRLNGANVDEILCIVKSHACRPMLSWLKSVANSSDQAKQNAELQVAVNENDKEITSGDSCVYESDATTSTRTTRCSNDVNESLMLQQATDIPHEVESCIKRLTLQQNVFFQLR